VGFALTLQASFLSFLGFSLRFYSPTYLAASPTLVVVFQ
jgi:hypothetical protein